MNLRVRRNQLKNKLEALEESIKSQVALTSEDVWKTSEVRLRLVERIRELDFLLTKEEEFDIAP